MKFMKENYFSFSASNILTLSNIHNVLKHIYLLAGNGQKVPNKTWGKNIIKDEHLVRHKL